MKSNQFELIAQRNRRGVTLIMKDIKSNAPVPLVEARRAIIASLIRNNEPRKVARVAAQEALWWIRRRLKNEEYPFLMVSYRAVNDGLYDAWVWCVTRKYYGTVSVRVGVELSIKEMVQVVKRRLRFYRDSKEEIRKWSQRLMRYYESSSKKVDLVKEEEQ